MTGANLDDALYGGYGNDTPDGGTGRDKPFDLTITRARIELRPVKWEVKDNVGIININTFSGNTGFNETSRQSCSV